MTTSQTPFADNDHENQLSVMVVPYAHTTKISTVLGISLSYMLPLHLYLLGEAGRGGAHHGPVGDSSIKHRLDWTDEAGLSRTDRTQEENPSLSPLITARSVGADGLHQARLFPRLKYTILAVQNNLNKYNKGMGGI